MLSSFIFYPALSPSPEYKRKTRKTEMVNKKIKRNYARKKKTSTRKVISGERGKEKQREEKRREERSKGE